MTKVIILRQEPKEEKKLKPIEFVKFLSGRLIIEDQPIDGDTASSWENVELICKSYTTKYDLMFVYDDDDRDSGILYLGHFNDGVVE